MRLPLRVHTDADGMTAIVDADDEIIAITDEPGVQHSIHSTAQCHAHAAHIVEAVNAAEGLRAEVAYLRSIDGVRQQETAELRKERDAARVKAEALDVLWPTLLKVVEARNAGTTYGPTAALLAKLVCNADRALAEYRAMRGEG